MFVVERKLKNCPIRFQSADSFFLPLSVMIQSAKPATIVFAFTTTKTPIAHRLIDSQKGGAENKKGTVWLVGRRSYRYRQRFVRRKIAIISSLHSEASITNVHECVQSIAKT